MPANTTFPSQSLYEPSTQANTLARKSGIRRPFFSWQIKAKLDKHIIGWRRTQADSTLGCRSVECVSLKPIQHTRSSGHGSINPGQQDQLAGGRTDRVQSIQTQSLHTLVHFGTVPYPAQTGVLPV